MKTNKNGEATDRLFGAFEKFPRVCRLVDFQLTGNGDLWWEESL